MAGQLVGSLLSGGKPQKQHGSAQPSSHGQGGLGGLASSFLGGQHGAPVCFTVLFSILIANWNRPRRIIMAILPVDKDPVAAGIPVKRHQQLISHPHNMAPASMVQPVPSTIRLVNQSTKPPSAMHQDTMIIQVLAIAIRAPPPHPNTVNRPQALKAVTDNIIHLHLGNLVLTAINPRRAVTVNRPNLTAPTLEVSKLPPILAHLLGNTVCQAPAPLPTASQPLHTRHTARTTATAPIQAKASSIRILLNRMHHTQASRVVMILTALPPLFLAIRIHSLGRPANMRLRPRTLATRASKGMEPPVVQDTVSSLSRVGTGSRAHHTAVQEHLQRRAGGARS